MHAAPRDILGETVEHAPRKSEAESAADSGRDREPKRDRYSFASGARPLEGYTIKRAIGRGGFGEVYYATSDAGKEVALKLITRNIEIERRGVSQCMNLKCPNLIAVHDLRTTLDGDTFVIMEYVAGPSLANVLANHPQGLPLPELRAWLRGMVEGVAYLHDHGIVHRDLKPANMFMEEGVVKIGDYGLSKSITKSQDRGHSESIGTCHYMAPEISSGKYHKPIDIYALGVILFEMLTGRVPFEGETVQEVLMKHLTSRPDLGGLPEPYRSLTARALAKDPNHRPISPYELLPSEDAPRAFSAGISSREPISNESTDDVFQIGEEESIFYIGPNTLPPKPGPRERLRAQWAAWKRNARQSVERERSATPPASRPRARESDVRAEPPELPEGRERMVELAVSMLYAAPLAFLAPFALDALFPLVPRDGASLRLLSLSLLTILAAWSVLVAGKVMEGRSWKGLAKRLPFLAVGLVLGVFGLALGDSDRLGPITGLPTLAALALCFFAPDWRKMTARDRRKRFRLGPVVSSAVAPIVLMVVFGRGLPPKTFAWLALVPSVAIIAQFVSPWDRQAAAYALAARRRRGRV